jgi:hypothetical protein
VKGAVRTFVMGDPQAPFAKVLDVLTNHGLLRGERLAPDVVLVSIGDHFDYDASDPGAGAEGLRTLRWLASHDAEQVVLVLGNHDTARVQELATLTQDGPPPGVLARDYASFSIEQRALVMQLLLAGRFHLALTATLTDGRPSLITHAGVTAREVAMLGVPPTPAALAAALQAHLLAAVDRVRDTWQRGELMPLSLAPLHIAGNAADEGGGLLYHRPSQVVPPGPRPRRFDPHTLPPGLTQVVGHSGHAKCLQELGDWATPAAQARAHGGIRTLRVGDEVIYDMGVLPPAADPNATADLILIDPELRRVPGDEVALLPIAGLGV